MVGGAVVAGAVVVDSGAVVVVVVVGHGSDVTGAVVVQSGGSVTGGSSWARAGARTATTSVATMTLRRRDRVRGIDRSARSEPAQGQLGSVSLPAGPDGTMRRCPGRLLVASLPMENRKTEDAWTTG